MLEHGGRLAQVAAQSGIPVAQWLDLSTGINPHAYPVPVLSAEVWRRLPEEEDGLGQIAARYYGAAAATEVLPAVLPIAGTQAAIQALPRVLTTLSASATAPLRVAVAHLTYNEYAHAWQQAGHVVTPYPHGQLVNAAATADVVMLCQPNNPTGEHLALSAIARMAATLAGQGGWLVIDEAYVDATPALSALPHIAAADWPQVIVLRSLGKFFGLAGARAGFAISAPEVINALRDELGPWPVSGPARAVARQALGDLAWQNEARVLLSAMAAKLDQCLARNLNVEPTGAALFRWFEFARADALHAHLANAAILVRQFASPPGGKPSLRIGLPADDQQLARLDRALEQFQ